MGKRHRVEFKRYDFPDLQSGKDICDRTIASMKTHMRRWVNEDHDITTAEEMKIALESHEGIRGCRFAVAEIDKATKNSQNNFTFFDDGIRAWIAYQIVESHFYPYSSLTTNAQGGAANKELKDKVSSLEKSLSEVRAHVDILCEDLETVITQVGDVEQHTRKHNLEIHGIAETADEDVTENVVKLGKVANVYISPSDIDICHQMGPRNSSGPKPITVRFKSHKKKTELYKARKHLKSVSLNQYFHATNVVYINENLTYLRRKLFAKVRKFKKDNHWQVPGLWTARYLLRSHRKSSQK